MCDDTKIEQMTILVTVIIALTVVTHVFRDLVKDTEVVSSAEKLLGAPAHNITPKNILY